MYLKYYFVKLIEVIFHCNSVAEVDAKNYCIVILRNYLLISDLTIIL